MTKSSLFIVLASLTIAPATADPGLAQRAYEVLQSRCYRCHGGSAKQAGLDVLSSASLTELRGGAGAPKYAFVLPGKPAESHLVQAVEGGDGSYMPKEGSPEAKAMTEEEKQILARWVASGAEFPMSSKRTRLGDVEILHAIRAHLLATPADNRLSTRFLTITHLHNDPTVQELDLGYARAAVAKAINSLSRRDELYFPRAVEGTAATVFAIDLGELGWDREGQWNAILGHYPYALKYDYVQDERLKQVWKDVAQFSGADIPTLRGDWFAVTATRPPLYHLLLEIPETLAELEKELQIDLRKNFLEGQVARAGFAKSGVSRQNRLLERHASPRTPYFWISYDFLPRRAKGDLTRFPLGPAFEGNPYSDQAFVHDGGEIIWSLPNGMQAYMLVDRDGRRIDAGPVEVVFDRTSVLGAPEIVNGISCMACHREGIVTSFRDELRDAGALGGAPLEHLRAIYPSHSVMSRVTEEDQRRFVSALKRVLEPNLADATDTGRGVSEPIGKIAELYSRDLTPHAMAAELGLESVEVLTARIEANRALLRFGLGTMVQTPPGTLKRDKWEARDGTSLMQDVARELRLGLPFVPARSFDSRSL